MRLNWAAYNFHPYDGYGRYGMHLVRALNRLGVDVTPVVDAQLAVPGWLQRLGGLDFSRLTISCMPPYMLRNLPGPQWALTMTEGSRLPKGWADDLNEKVERVIVPCEWNADACRKSGVRVPVHVVHGGTCPAEFPAFRRNGRARTYTFLSLADRGARKGWVEVWQAFYRAFGTPADTPDVRLLVKTRPHTNDLIDRMATASGRDPRVSFWQTDADHIGDVYAMADCFAIPSRSEGWGMPHREAAMMGLPVIVTRFAGLDDGHTDDWGIVVEKTAPATVPAAYDDHMTGEWVKADVGELSERMRWCYEHPEDAALFGQAAAQWLRENQTWTHSAENLLDLIRRVG